MSWLALLLVGVGLTDLLHSALPRRFRARLAGSMSGVLAVVPTVGTGLLAGLLDPMDLLALAAIAALVVAWAWTVTRGFSRDAAWLPLTLLGTALVVAVALSPAAGAADGPLGRWLAQVPFAAVAAASPDQVLLVVGAVLVQLSTGNVVVRLVLSATGTLNPAHTGEASDPETRLKGGRLLGPMERVFILGLGLAGQLTAAAIVIGAKGLLRFPELYTRSEQERIHQLTEYFLVGSFASWLLALGSLLLAAG